jgi:predicted DNA-binding protein with PD1-like motif
MTNEARPERGVRCADEIREQLPAHGSFADSHRRFRKSDGRMVRFRKEDYKKIEVGEQCEVLSAIGDVANGDEGKASLHVHVVLGLSDGATRGDHLLAGTVRPTLEVVLIDTPSHLRRKKKPDLGIALIDLKPTTE